MATGPSATTRRRAGGSDDGRADPALPQKKRARQRLIGAIALCGVAAVVVPMLLEPEPTRPGSEIAIVIPSRDTPLPARPAEAVAADAVRGGPSARGAIDPAPAGDGGAREPKGADPRGVEVRPADSKTLEAKAGESKPADPKSADPKSADPRSTDARSAAKSAPPRAGEAKAADGKAADGKAAGTPDARVPRKDAQGDEIARLAEAAQGRSRPEAPSRYVLQVGAYSGEAGAASAVDKVEGTGLSAFTEKIRTDRGERVRVRVGPFPTREAAEQARARLKAAGIEAAVIAP